MVRGKKNFLPPAQLLLGFAAMFQISEESKARHIKHRVQDADSALGTSESGAASTAEQTEQEEPAQEPSDSESDEDFPDAKLESASDGSDDEGEVISGHNNPLQTGSSIPLAQDGLSESELSDKGDKDDHDAVEDVEESASQEVTAEGAPTRTPVKATGSTRHMSARERRLLRKGQDTASISNTATEDEADDPPAAEAASALQPDASNAAPASTKPKPLARGKRGKQKKIQTKYANQDEEDRALAMSLLGSRAGPESSQSQAEAKRTREEEAAAQKQRRREQHQRAQAAGQASEAARRLALEGGEQEGGGAAAADEAENDDEAARLEQVGLDAFTGRPLPGDELLAAMPVCAPWAALATYKYKVKLQPGAQKKGKAVKEILARWDADAKDGKKVDRESSDAERIWPREAELIKAWKDVEVVGVVPVSKVRAMLSGAGGKEGGGGGGKGKKAARGGRGSKKAK